MSEQDAVGGEDDAAGVVEQTSWRSWYTLGVLFVVYVFNFIDRSILGILNQAIKDDLGFSDTQMGFLGGIAFAIFYSILGVPIARLADRSVRRNVLAVSLTVWSVMTAVCGFAGSFMQLMLGRIGVAVGEAGGSPPSHSMISDMFPPSSRATALAIYALGIPVGNMIGNLAGGWINEAFDWRTAFIVVGLPGLVLAVIVVLTVKEPVRGASEVTLRDDQEVPPVSVVFRYLWSLKSFRYMSLAGAMHAFVGYGVGYWLPAFFIRSHGLGTAEIGRWVFFLGFAGMAGTFLGGYFADRLARRDLRWYVWLPGIALHVRRGQLCGRVPGRGHSDFSRLILSRTNLRPDSRPCGAAHARAGVEHSSVHFESDRAWARASGDGYYQRCAPCHHRSWR
jgi:MFS family permease